MTKAATATRARILLVEEDTPTANTLTTILDRLGYETAHAGTLAAAFEKLDQWPPRCVFLDLALPDGNGIELLRRIRENRLPISVAVTTGAALDELAEVKALQPDALFRKPLHFRDLMDWLHAAARH